MGFRELEEAIVSRIFQGGTDRDWSVAINARHQSCLEKAAAFLRDGKGALLRGAPAELIAEEIRSALECVGEIVGRADVEDVLGKIFSTFCIGK